MKIFHSLDEVENINKPFITIGIFDGVHTGHQKIINELVMSAKENNGSSCLLTFFPHPRHVLQKDSLLKTITSSTIKARKLKALNLDVLIIIPFTYKFSRMSSFEFVREVLVNKLNIDSLLLGYDHQFGKNREGDYNQLKELSEMFGFKLQRLNAVSLEDSPISSTKIRNALQNGDLEYANGALGENFYLDGIVVHGDKIGSKIGFPTANLLVEEYQIVPKNGVYHVIVTTDFGQHIGMMNIGYRPSIKFSENELKLEVHLFDFDKDLYDKTIQVQFIKRIRDEKKFSSTQELTHQLQSDKNYILNI